MQVKRSTDMMVRGFEWVAILTFRFLQVLTPQIAVWPVIYKDIREKGKLKETVHFICLPLYLRTIPFLSLSWTLIFQAWIYYYLFYRDYSSLEICLRPSCYHAEGIDEALNNEWIENERNLLPISLLNPVMQVPIFITPAVSCMS